MNKETSKVTEIEDFSGKPNRGDKDEWWFACGKEKTAERGRERMITPAAAA